MHISACHPRRCLMRRWPICAFSAQHEGVGQNRGELNGAMGAPIHRVELARVDILIGAHSGDLTYGAQRSLLEFCLHLKSQGIKIHVVSPTEGSFTERLDQESIPFSIVWMPQWVGWPNDSRAFLFRRADPRKNTIVKLVDLIRRIGPQLCATNTITFPWVAYAAAITNTRHAWFIRESGVHDFNLKYAIGVAATRRSISALSDAVFYNSEFTAREYAGEIESSKSKGVIYPGGDALIPECIEDPFSPGSFRVVIVGGIQSGKGQLDAIRALALARMSRPSVELVVVGGVVDRKYADALESEIGARQLQGAVRFVGFQANPFYYLALADLVLVCSRHEAFGRTTVEAMVAGKPVIGADAGGTAEIISDGETGILYPPGDVQGLAERILLIQGTRRCVPGWGRKQGRSRSNGSLRSRAIFPSTHILLRLRKRTTLAYASAPLRHLLTTSSW